MRLCRWRHGPHGGFPQDHEKGRMGGLPILVSRFRGTRPSHPCESLKEDRPPRSSMRRGKPASASRAGFGKAARDVIVPCQAFLIGQRHSKPSRCSGSNTRRRSAPGAAAGPAGTVNVVSRSCAHRIPGVSAPVQANSSPIGEADQQEHRGKRRHVAPVRSNGPPARRMPPGKSPCPAHHAPVECRCHPR